MSEANKLLMMFVRDSYKSASGKHTKKTAIALMRFVAGSPALQALVNSGDHTGILNYKPEQEYLTESELEEVFEWECQYLLGGFTEDQHHCMCQHEECHPKNKDESKEQ